MCICWHFRSKRLGHGPFSVDETSSLLGHDDRPLIPEERVSNPQSPLLGRDGRPLIPEERASNPQ